LIIFWEKDFLANGK